jgi:DNA-binding IclR family transcriptional regulator
MHNKKSGRVIKSVMTALELVGHIRTTDSVTVTELADQADLTPGTVHTHLSTLKRAGYVVQQGTEYSLGPQFVACGEHVRNTSKLYQASKKQVDELAENTGECAHLIIEHDGKLFALYERFGPKAVGVELHNRKRAEALNHLHCTAAGKSILAHLPEDRVQEIIDESNLQRNTSRTTTDAQTLAAELERVREQGFALVDEEQMQGIRAAGAPVLDVNEQVVGAIALSAPTSRLQGSLFREEIPKMVMEAANISEVNLQTANFEERYM